ncbi:MAG: SDR family NAD(P)-dependent oxidoreductase, partial [Gemmatimonadales bacterium]
MTITNAGAVVTGGTEGIGLATIRALGQAGARVAFCARTADRVSVTEATLRGEGLVVHGFPCD